MFSILIFITQPIKKTVYLNRRDFLKTTTILSGGFLLPAYLKSCQSPEKIWDLVIYGATSAGIIAAVKAAQMGCSCILIEPSSHIGGLTTGGLGATDLGYADAIGGMSRGFYQRLREYYKDDAKWKYEAPKIVGANDTSWFFEPSAAMAVYKQMLEENNIPVVLNDRLVLGSNGVNKRGNSITSIVTEKGNVYQGKMFIDASYEGDLMAMAGVSFHVGRESNSVYGETLNGIQKVRTHYHIFPGFVDPYIEPGNPKSGILPGVHGEEPGKDFEGDHRIQAYCYRLCLTDVEENSIPFEKPQGYEELEYELLFRNFEAGENRIPWLPHMMPNRKTDTNNRWGFSTNKIGINYAYPNGNYGLRESILAEQEHFQKGLMWTLANHPRVPEPVRREVKKWGLAADEFTQNGSWPSQIYVREARRMIGEYVMTENDCRRVSIADQSIGMGSYTMDSHNVQRYITRMGCVQNEGNIEVSTGGPYVIPYGCILPKRHECDNLLVTCAMSASHIAFGSIRMEPVFMILGQSAATAASLALETNSGLHELSYPRLKEKLLADQQRLDLDREKFPALLPESELPRERKRIDNEPIAAKGCVVDYFD
ncbi:FAD-dependent oxidoreductase [Cyclobacteriaceae bacterium YHN15]|nr:FAD-dependent oxidoreductase [Cyclobacteriaceae bacterium YHN15]